MRIGDLSKQSQVSVPTIKYYLREGLLPAGAPTATNQADYGETHLERLRLIRALIDVGRLTVSAARDVLAAVDAPDLPPHHKLGTAQHAISRTTRTDPADPAWAAARSEIDALVTARDWWIDADAPALHQATEAVRTMRALGLADILTACLPAYADAADAVAAREVSAVAARHDPTAMVHGVIVGTLLGESLLNALRLLAQQNVSARTFGP